MVMILIGTKLTELETAKLMYVKSFENLTSHWPFSR
jgi:hypothetical protein